jgi:predicted lysophospholipase L1 biosynthesis ABC-type transport system permease subunit
VIKEKWVFLPGTLAATLLAGIAVTAGLGLIATWRALGERPAAALRSL